MNRLAPRVPVAQALVAALLLAGCVPDSNRRDRVDAAYLALVAAEDARPTEGPALDLIVQAARADNVFLRRAGVRALGRLETPRHAELIALALDDASPSVRNAAANALAQTYQTSSGDAAFPILVAQLEKEHDPEVRGTLARSIGRLRLDPGHTAEAVDVLLDASFENRGYAPLPVVLGVALGLESRARAPGAGDLGARAAARLRQMTRYGEVRPFDLGPGRVRTLAVATLGQMGQMTAALVGQALQDEHPQVGATAFRYVDQVVPDHLPELLRRAVSNNSVQTIIEAFRYINRQPRTAMTCRYLFSGAPTRPPEVPVQLPNSIRVMAIDGLAQACPDLGEQVRILQEIVEELPSEGDGWQPAAHALFALASVAPGSAASLLHMQATHDNAFVRARATRTAATLGNRLVLRELARDEVPNVRTAAVQGLFGLDGHAIDEMLLAQLEWDDPQLLMTSARLLSGTSRRAETAAAAISALERVSEARRETWRDSRRALLERIGEVGDVEFAPRLLPFLSDYDSLVAADAARILRDWRGRPYATSATPLPRAPLPTVAELRSMNGATVTLHMEGGGEVHITLLPYESTTNTWRFYRLVRDGYFDGLTFHRWAPNFVLQGGSPNANEYQGDAMYARDEVGLIGHWRGFVGISTRGHDTADGQIFVNLMDNVRLDHLYTIVGAVTTGMDVVDDALEGARIERAEVRPGS
jgi:cyclophilin family peptidyl-prolyl cis-trans isomerase/HEAT repeat protein